MTYTIQTPTGARFEVRVYRLRPRAYFDRLWQDAERWELPVYVPQSFGGAQ